MKTCFPTLLPAALLALILGGCATKVPAMKMKASAPTAVAEKITAAPPEPVISGKLINAVAAIVNDDIVTLYEVNQEAGLIIKEKQKTAPLDTTARTQIPKAALDALIEKMLVKQKIRVMNVKASDDEIRQSIEDVKRQNNLSQAALVSALAAQGLTYDQYVSQLREQLEKLKLISMEVRAKIHVSDSEIREFYDANPDKFSEEDEFRARHIFFRTSENAPPEQIKSAMNSALMVLAESKGGKDFIELAKTYSQDPAARKDGGDLGRFKKGDMQPELEKAIIALKPGEVSELVYTSLGLHIIKLEERIKGKLKPLETVKAGISEMLYRKKSEERFSQWAKDLRGKSSVEIKDLKGLI